MRRGRQTPTFERVGGDDQEKTRTEGGGVLMEQPNTWHRGLSKRLMEVMAEIDALPDPEAEASPLDAAKRKRGGA